MLTLNGTVVRVATLLDNLYTYDVEVQKFGEGQSTAFKLIGGYAGTLLQELSHLLDFKIELVTDAPGLTYNFSLAFQNYSVDLLAASFFLDEDRLKFANPTFITRKTRISVFLNHGFEGSMQDVLIAPLTSGIWQLLALTILFCSAAFCFAANYSERVGFLNSFFQIFSIFLMRDAALRVQSWSSRIIQLTASITVLLLMSAYSAKIYSIGAVRVNTINTLAGLVKSSFDVSYDTGYGNGTILIQSENSIPIVSAIDAKASKSKFRFDTYESAMKEVQSRPFAYIIGEEGAYAATERAFHRLPCELGIESIYYADRPLSMFTRKGFKHRDALNLGIIHLAQTGVLRKFARRWIPGRAVAGSATDCSARNVAEFSGVYLSQLDIAFEILIAGALCACVVLVLEICKRRIH